MGNFVVPETGSTAFSTFLERRGKQWPEQVVFNTLFKRPDFLLQRTPQVQFSDRKRHTLERQLQEGMIGNGTPNGMMMPTNADDVQLPTRYNPRTKQYEIAEAPVDGVALVEARNPALVGNYWQICA